MTSTRMTETVPANEAADETEFVLPKPPRHAAPLLVGGAEAGGSPTALRRAAAGLAAAGGRIQVLLECQDRFLGEMRAALREMDDSLHEESRARLKAKVRSLVEILDWCEAVQVDLLLEGRRASWNQQLVDLRALCDDAAHDLRGARGELAVEIHGDCPTGVWAELPLLGDVIRGAFEVVADRIGGQGQVAVELQEQDGGPSVWVRGTGAPTSAQDPVALERFRSAAAAAGVRVAPDALGPGGTGLILEVPAQALRSPDPLP
jgi:hypothetical protein